MRPQAEHTSFEAFLQDDREYQRRAAHVQRLGPKSLGFQRAVDAVNRRINKLRAEWESRHAAA